MLQTLSSLSKAGLSGPAFSFRKGRPLPHPLEEKIASLVAPVVRGAGFELVRVKLMGRQTMTLQVMAERADRTMNAEDCATLSRALSALLDEADPLPGAYRLEVSSPGVDRPLTRLKDYEDWQGYEAKIELGRMVEGRKRFQGVVAGVEGDSVCLDIEGEAETALIPFAWIANGRLVLTDELIRESLKAAKAARKETDDVQSGEQP
ncbi:MAG: ribosome maturation factor RimP [Amphiplicatus sp.]